MLRPAALLLLAACCTSALADPPPEPKVERTVAEDDQVRIEELKVRGETRKVTVNNKLSKAPEYEIMVNDDSVSATHARLTRRCGWQTASRCRH